MRPIGVFDSGVGGLTVVAALQRRLRGESILYLGDTARLPYGTKSPQTIRRYTRKNLEFLLSRHVKAVVVACNTASALAHDALDVDVPIWEVVGPGARKAAETSRHRIGIIATESTVRSDAYPLALRQLRPDLEVISQACPLFVPLVEEGWQDDSVTEEIARRYLAPLVESHIDTLVLGCTHYPLLKPMLRRILPASTAIVDSAESIAGEVAAGLARLDLLADGGSAESHFCVTDASERFRRIARSFLGAESVSLELVEVV